MAVDTTIPHSSNNVGDDLSAIRENFELLASAQVVDEGSTEDGDYIRYENGWQFIYKSEVEVTTEGSSFGDIVRVSFPLDFVDNANVVVGFSLSNESSDAQGSGSFVTAYTECSIATNSRKEWSLRMANDYTALFSDTLLDFYAIGRWK